MLGELNHAK